MLPYKMDRESFWVTPTQVDCSNSLLGKMFDDLFEENMMQMSELQEKAVKFVQQQTQSPFPTDFQFVMSHHQNMNTGFDFPPGYF